MLLSSGPIEARNPRCLRPSGLQFRLPNERSLPLFARLLAREAGVLAGPPHPEAVAAMARRRFSLVTMDRQMPVMKGDAATEAARAAGYTGTIVMVSGDTFSPAKEAALRGMGVTAFLGKMGTLSIHDAVARLGELKRDEAAGGGVGGVPGPVSVGAVVGAPAAAVAVVAV